MIEHRGRKTVEMKLFAHPKSLTDAMTPLITLSSLLGIRPFSYPCHWVKLTINLVYSLLLYILYVRASLDMQTSYYANTRFLMLEYILYQIMGYVIIFSVTMKLFLSWWHIKRIKTCHKMIDEIDKTLQQLGLTINHDKIYVIIIGTIIIWFAMTFAISIFVFLDLELDKDPIVTVYVIIAYSYALTVNAFIIFEFYIFVKCSQMRFELVNKLLRDSLTNSSSREMKLGIFEMKDYAKCMNAEQPRSTYSKALLRWCRQMQSRINSFVPGKQNSVESQMRSYFPSQFQKQFKEELQSQPRRHTTIITSCQERIHLLQTIKQVHLGLRKVSKILCNISGIHIAWEIAVTIMFLTGVFYNLYIRYVVPQQNMTQEITLWVMMIITHISRTIFLCRACKRATYEGNKTIEIIHAIYSCRASNDMQDEIQQFGIQILQSPVVFCVFGILLDNHVLSLTLKTVTIYLVIMIQVSNSLESNRNTLKLIT